MMMSKALRFVSFLLLLHPQASMATADLPKMSTCSKLSTVKEGDTCASMSSAAKLSINGFLAINPALNCSSLQVGDLTCVSPCHRHPTHSMEKGLLVDYIGAIGIDIELAEVPIKDNLEQFLILAFAIDADANAVTQNGKFSPYWVSSITPQSVAAVKASHPNLKVLMSLAGYSLYVASTGETHVVDWYDPKDPQSWLENALESVGSLVETYHLDGIDIDYETFPESKTFAKLVGTLIKRLKEEKKISIATIAPYESVLPYYKKLYKRYKRQIDYVNYQFYANNFSTAGEYAEAYNRMSKVFPRRKLLAGLEVGPTARRPTADVFFEAFSELKREHGSVPGFFLWAADHSKGEGFLVEKVGQCIL